jgi:molecular chaperone DnaK
MAELIVGIDLGTTNSEIAIVENGLPRVLAVDGSPILPSMVGLTDDGRLLVGTPARNQWVVAPERTIKSIKRKMGQDVQVDLGPQKYRPQEISAIILKRLKTAAEEQLGQPIRKAVITVPAYFNDTQRQATREAGELAGLEVVRIINEPTAAALTYHPDQSGQERFLVYDLGGGTFDVSIVNFESGVFEVLASHGDTQLGGDDFDDLLVKHIAEEFLDMFQVDLRENRVSLARLMRAAEAAKRQLSDHPFVRLEEEYIAEKDGVPLHLSTEVSRSTYEELIKPLIDRTMACVQQTLDDARIVASQIQRVVLVGGSTRTPLISQLLEERLGQPPHKEINPDLCVALGAAVQGAMIAGSRVGSVLVDITPHTLGIKTFQFGNSPFAMGNEFFFSPIIRRNTALPTTRSEVYSTVSDNQEKVDIEVFQGEQTDVRRNHRVGKFTIEGLAKVPAGNQITVQLDLTLDGTLKVTAREKATGHRKEVTIENVMMSYAVTERNAARERLGQLWGPEPVEDGPVLTAGPAQGQRETVQANALLEKAERILAKISTEDRDEVERLITSVRIALTDRQWPELTTAMGELSDVLFYLEDA